jgi:1,5-anhydro-D-fructose reductase (1,5-anhydro-D-mannitol-forming)
MSPPGSIFTSGHRTPAQDRPQDEGDHDGASACGPAPARSGCGEPPQRALDWQGGPVTGWGLVGASDIAARSLVPAIRAQPGSSVVAVHSRSGERGRAYAAEHGVAAAYDRLEDLLADPQVEAVYVSTTNNRHADEVVAAATAGVHVLCEKPLATTLHDALRMVHACRTAGVVLATNHGRRQEAGVRELRRLVASGRLGEVVGVHTATGVRLPERLQGWRLTEPGAGAGVVLDIVVHEADALRFVLTDEVAEVVALTANQGLAGDGVEDAVAGALRMRGGALGSYACSFVQPHGEQGLRVDGREASAVLQRAAPGGPATLALLDGAGRTEVPLPPQRPVGELTVRAFESAVRGEGEPSATGEDGVASLAVALAALESARTGRSGVPGFP